MCREYGKSGDLPTNRRDEQEMSVLCMRILQAAMVYVNTLMLQGVLADPEWEDLLTPEDRRGPTLPFWSHVLPYLDVLWTCYLLADGAKATHTGAASRSMR